MRTLVFLTCAAVAPAIEVTSRVVDPTGAGIPSARVVYGTALAVVRATHTDAVGRFRLEIPNLGDGRIIITAPGFATATLAPEHLPDIVRLELAPQMDAVTVTGSAVPAPASEQGSSISVLPRAVLEQRNEATVIDLLRLMPGVTVSQNGQRGTVGSVFIRGGNSNHNLVLLDGVPVNRFGGEFDFSRMPADQLERVDVLRGAQSAAHGQYANSGVVSFVTRHGGTQPHFDALAEGGSHSFRRFAAGGGGVAGGLELSLWASKLDTDGVVANNDFRNDFVSAGVGRRFGRHSLTGRAYLSSNENGVPGPYGADPAGNFSGLDTVSRDRFNWSVYTAQFTSDFSPRFRQEFSGGLFINNNSFRSPFGSSFNDDLRGVAEARSLVLVRSGYTAAFGVGFSRERVENTFITDSAFRVFPLERNHTGLYLENRIEVGSRVFLNAGARLEIIRTTRVAANAASGRPEFPPDTVAKVNPRISAAWTLSKSTTVKSSIGTGIRSPDGFQIAFTNNPALKPERTITFDAGLERRLGRNRAAVEVAYFYNRYYDLIVTLGGSLARLSSYRSDNLANSRAHGVELSGRLRPAAALLLQTSYTWLDSEILSLDGTSGLAPAFFAVGQPLIRRPHHSASLESTWMWRRISANVILHGRSRTLDVEPNFGASAGLYYNPGYVWSAFNLNLRVTRGVTLYGNLRNAFDRRYEEILGYPAPRLNFVSGIKWNFEPE